jgi:hypothetical protein
MNFADVEKRQVTNMEVIMAKSKHDAEFKEHMEWLNNNISGAAEEVSTRFKHAINALYNLVAAESKSKKKSAAKPKKAKAATPKKRGKAAATKKSATKKSATKKTAVKRPKKSPKKATKNPAKKRAK